MTDNKDDDSFLHEFAELFQKPKKSNSTLRLNGKRFYKRGKNGSYEKYYDEYGNVVQAEYHDGRQNSSFIKEYFDDSNKLKHGKNRFGSEIWANRDGKVIHEKTHDKQEFWYFYDTSGNKIKKIDKRGKVYLNKNGKWEEIKYDHDLDKKLSDDYRKHVEMNELLMKYLMLKDELGEN